MLGSLMKQLWRTRLGRGGYDGDMAALPYHDFSKLTESITTTAREMLDKGYLDYPIFVQLETLAVCNAACDFCPYPNLERQGTKMPDATIEKVIDDLTAMPPSLFFRFAPYKISEPFLEPRLFDIVRLAESRLPGMTLSLITNGTALTERKIEQLKQVKRISYMTISLNFDDAEEYERVMQLPFARTLERLDALHKKVVQKELAFPVRVSRVSGEKHDDESFIRFVRSRYPAFSPMVVPRNDWLGGVVTEGSRAQIPEAPCHRWFDLSITATGVVAMCCMDGEAHYPKGDVNTQHVLEIYNQPWLRDLRRKLPLRREARSPCDRCTYLAS